MTHPVLTLAVVGALALSAGCGGDTASLAGRPCSTGCGSGTTCDPVSRLCVCPAGGTLCGNRCVDLRSDGANCAGCGLPCVGGQCLNGRCGNGACATGAVDCGGTCVDVSSNPSSCGGCNNRCSDGAACTNGACTASPCGFGAESCGGQCRSLASSPDACGACGRSCGGQLCSEGNCVSACPAGRTKCSGACTNLAHDATNCGTCGNVCGADQICATDGDGKIKCRDFHFASCSACPCNCQGRTCCVVPGGSGYVALCVEDGCPAP